jgi:protein gp37
VRGHPFEQGFDLRFVPEKLNEPLRWKKPQRIFVNSMSDLFHDDVPLEYIQRTFEVMNQANWHQYQILTKRAERLEAVSGNLPWAPHIWMGVSVEDKDHVWRVDHLRRTKACLKFLSIEPLIGPLGKLELRAIDWVIVGGESGPGARPMHEAWVTDILDQCRKADVAFFFKQWGGVQKGRFGRVLQGRTWDEMPASVCSGGGGN